MQTTERLYYTDSHLTEFDARVISVSRTADGRTAVTLDRTAFYPTGGGQPTDTGTLGAARVVECVDEEERGVLHVIEGDAAPVGMLVRGRVDWPRRLDHMQQHTGQHILSQAFIELFQAPTRSFRMRAQSCEIDLELRDPSDEKIERAVDRANEVIWDDRPVRIRNVTPEEAAALPLRKDSAREGELRIIEIENFDLSPCGGTHAGRTGEVGLICARSWERAKGMTRVEFVAGRRALADYRRANHTARSVAALFSAARDEAFAAVARLQEEKKHLTRRVRELEEVTARIEAVELLAATGARTSDGARLVAHIFESRDVESLKRLAHAIAAEERACALLGSRDGDGSARLIFARSADTARDMNALMRQACATLEGRGGGRAEMAQGGGPRAERLAKAIEEAARALREGAV